MNVIVHHCWSCRRGCVQAEVSSGTAGSRLTAGPGKSTPQTIGRFHCLLPLLSLASDSEKRSPHECTRTAGGARHHMTLSQLTYNLTSTDMVRLAVNLQGLQSLSTSDRKSVKNIPPFEMMDTGKTISLSWCRRVTYRAQFSDNDGGWRCFVSPCIIWFNLSNMPSTLLECLGH